ncbi:MAG: DUF4255 domain-containing protein [Bacteroidetes bacterium]|nr:DUF4255 domain-containing protein [Bacteroidota bacterium]
MINQALQFTRITLDQFLRQRFLVQESKVILNKLNDPSGNAAKKNENRVVITLINIEKEVNKQFYGRSQRTASGSFSEVQPFERYNIDLLISSNFDDYSETLKFLNASILFFQINPSLTGASFGNIPPGISKLEFDIEKITYHQMHSLWTAMGANYVPSVIYKMRLVTIQGEETSGYTSAVSGATANVS